MSLRWDRAFIRQSLEWAAMSKDPNTSVGAVVVGPDREVRSTGFNGFPRGIIDTPDRLNNRDLKLKLIVHAERNAICNAARIGVSLKGCSLYLAATDASKMIWGGPPCTACTIELIQCGIVEIISLPKKSVPSRWHDDLEMAESLLAEANITYREIIDL
jgi:dCMP deaminase